MGRRKLGGVQARDVFVGRDGENYMFMGIWEDEEI